MLFRPERLAVKAASPAEIVPRETPTLIAAQLRPRPARGAGGGLEPRSEHPGRTERCAQERHYDVPQSEEDHPSRAGLAAKPRDSQKTEFHRSRRSPGVLPILLHLPPGHLAADVSGRFCTWSRILERINLIRPGGATLVRPRAGQGRNCSVFKPAAEGVDVSPKLEAGRPAGVGQGRFVAKNGKSDFPVANSWPWPQG